EEGWKLGNEDMPLVNAAVSRLKKLGARVILFIDPDPSVVDRVPGSGADGVEIYTGSYADAFRQGDPDAMRKACAATAARAAERGLAVNAGHDLNLDNLPALVAALPNLAEASIGHELTADALKVGWQMAVRAYKAALAG
ncbi:MAG: pyridoxine 5'-phosphate synthase, partial [Stellaceae bacterium]